jgi:hypothetical protein
MAIFEAKEFSFSDIHNGERYQNGDIPDAEAINKPIEASAYAVEMARSALAHTGGSEENLQYVASPNGSYPNMTAGKLGGNWSTENVVNGTITNPTQSGVYLCYISANAYLLTSIIFVTTYHGNSWGTSSIAETSYGPMRVFTKYEKEENCIKAIAFDVNTSTEYTANIIGYYRMI